MHVQMHARWEVMTVTTTGEPATEKPTGRGDEALISAVRGGDIAAFGALYARHAGAARRVAVSWAASPSERDDIVAEGFVRVLGALCCGGGPNTLFRPYLFTTMRNVVISWRRKDAAVSLVAAVPEAPTSVNHEDDPADSRAQAALAADAFASLPERWRTVLWHLEIEGRTPTQVASMLGMQPNGVSALAYRARKGLRKAYLHRMFLEMPRTLTCGTIVELAQGLVVRRSETSPGIPPAIPPQRVITGGRTEATH